MIKPVSWLFPTKPKPGTYVLRSGDSMTISFTVHIRADDLIEDWDGTIEKSKMVAALDIDGILSRVEVCL